MNFGVLFQTIILITSILIVILILLQQRGASLGAGFGGSGELYTTRRGLDKSLFGATVVCVVIFVLSIIALLIIPS